MEELKDIELIDRYLEGSLSLSETRLFENRLETETPFKQTYEEVKEVILAVQVSEEARIRAILKEEEEKLENHKLVVLPKNRFTPFLLRGVAAAASTTLLAVAAYWLLIKPKDEPFNFAYKHNTWIATNGGGKKGSTQLPQNNEMVLANYGKEAGEKLIKGLSLYDDEQFDAAAQVLLSINLQNDTLALYQANALIKANKETQGIDILEKMPTNSPLSMERDWYIASAYLKMGDKAKAQEKLRIIANNPLHIWQANAQELLK